MRAEFAWQRLLQLLQSREKEGASSCTGITDAKSEQVLWPSVQERREGELGELSGEPHVRVEASLLLALASLPAGALALVVLAQLRRAWLRIAHFYSAALMTSKRMSGTLRRLIV